MTNVNLVIGKELAEQLAYPRFRRRWVQSHHCKGQQDSKKRARSCTTEGTPGGNSRRF